MSAVPSKILDATHISSSTLGSRGVLSGLAELVHVSTISICRHIFDRHFGVEICTEPISYTSAADVVANKETLRCNFNSYINTIWRRYHEYDPHSIIRPNIQALLDMGTVRHISCLMKILTWFFDQVIDLLPLCDMSNISFATEFEERIRQFLGPILEALIRGRMVHGLTACDVECSVRGYVRRENYRG